VNHKTAFYSLKSEAAIFHWYTTRVMVSLKLSSWVLRTQLHNYVHILTKLIGDITSD